MVKESRAQTELEKILAELVAMPTMSTDTIACQAGIEMLTREFETAGLHVTTGGDVFPWFVATTRHTKHPKVMLAAHLDIIPPSQPDHFTMQVDGDVIKGRGVYDMKFAIACYVEFVRRHKKDLSSYDLGIMITTDEELGGYECARYLADDGWGAEAMFLPDGGENWHLEDRAKGGMGIGLKASGKSAHGSRPWEGDNPLERLMPILQHARSLVVNNDHMDTTLSINRISGGMVYNQIPDKAEALIDVRSFNKETLSDIYSSISDKAAEHGVNCELVVDIQPVTLDKHHPSTKALLQSITTVTQRKAEFTHSYGASDARWFTAYGTSVLLVRPKGGDPHGPNEWLERTDLGLFYELVVDFVKRAAVDKPDVG